MVEQEVSSDCCGKLPKDPCLLNSIPVNAPLNHHLNGLLQFFPGLLNLYVLVYDKALLGEDIPGSIFHSIVGLPVVTVRGVLAFMFLSLQLGGIFTES